MCKGHRALYDQAKVQPTTPFRAGNHAFDQPGEIVALIVTHRGELLFIWDCRFQM